MTGRFFSSILCIECKGICPQRQQRVWEEASACRPQGRDEQGSSDNRMHGGRLRSWEGQSPSHALISILVAIGEQDPPPLSRFTPLPSHSNLQRPQSRLVLQCRREGPQHRALLPALTELLFRLRLRQLFEAAHGAPTVPA